MFDPIQYNQQELAERSSIFLEVLGEINAKEFEYSYELWGVFWMPWFVEVDGKDIRFPLNEISVADFDYMEQKGLLVFVKDLENRDDRFGRKIYQIQ